MKTAFVIIAIVLFALATIGIGLASLNLVALGLAFWCASSLV